MMDDITADYLTLYEERGSVLPGAPWARVGCNQVGRAMSEARSRHRN